MVDGYTLVLACLLLPAGALGDRYGRRGALLVGLAIFAVASVAPTFFDSPLQIIVARAVAGIGAAFIMPATLSLLTAAFPKDERNKAIGIWAGVASSGAIVGFMGTGVLLHFFEWQSIFYAFAIASLVLFVCTCTISSSRDEPATPVDWVGAVLIGGAVAIFVFGVIEAPVRGWTHPVVWGCMAAGLALALAFAIVELRRTHPLLDVRLFPRPDFATGSIGITFLFFANFGFFFLVMQYMQLILGYSPLETAWALGPVAVPHRAGSDDAPDPSQGRPTAGGQRRPAPDRRRAVQHEVPGRRLVLHRSRLAVPDHQRRHRALRRADDVGHHERGAHRQAGSRVGGQRHDARSRSGAGHRRRGFGARRAVHPRDGPGLHAFPKQFAAPRPTPWPRRSKSPNSLGRRGLRWQSSPSRRSSMRWTSR